MLASVGRKGAGLFPSKAKEEDLKRMPTYLVRAGEIRTFEDGDRLTYLVMFKGKEYRPGKLPFVDTHFDSEREAHISAN
jgi:hypothetical protein